MVHPLTSVQLFVASLSGLLADEVVCVCVLCFSGGDRADDRAVPAEAEGAAGGRVQGGRAERPAGGAEEQPAGASSPSSSSPQHLLHG